ncbi:MAG: hypothetical protein JW818_16630 [Pirellulales bacterium]|nr:hypothetical protein [Pirellulales bacterium]
MAVLLAFTTGVVAQEPAVVAPPAAGAVPAKGQTKGEGEDPEKFLPKDPAIEAITATKLDTPVKLVRAAIIVADLGELKLAKDYLKKVLDANLDEAGLTALGDEIGSSVFLRWTSREDLAPEGNKLAQAVLNALDQRRRASDRIVQLIGELSSDTPDVRDRAVANLISAGESAVEPLIGVLADPQRKSEHAAARAALVHLGSASVRPLSAWIRSPDTALVGQLIRVLAEGRSRDATIYLLAPYASLQSDPAVREAARKALLRLVGTLPKRPEAAHILAGRAREYFQRRRGLRQDDKGLVEVWQWDPAKKRAVAKQYPTDVASAVLAARLAGDAFAIAPNDESIRRLYLLALLERATLENGLDKPPPTGEGTPAARAAEFGEAAVEAALNEAMAKGRAPAAAAAAQVLGQIGTAKGMLGARVQPGPLAKAVRSPDRRVQFAAVGAIMRLQPTESFAGASIVPETLGFLATGTGARKALVAAPTQAEVQQVASLVIPLGYEVDTAVTGRETLAKLFSSADYEFVLVDALIDRPPLGMLIQQIRRDSRTGSLPVGVLMNDQTRDQARRAARNDDLVLAFSRPHDDKAIKWQIDRLMELVGRNKLGPEERQRQAIEALGWLAELGVQERPVFNFHRAEEAALSAVYVPALGKKAVATLATMGTPESQTALVDLASRRTQPIALRQAAAAAFAETVKKHGTLLRTDQILRQYDRYNQSETADPATQKVLGSILDTLESRK